MDEADHQSHTDFLSARLRMVELQLQRRDIYDPAVLEAMRRVPRHEFVLPEDRAQAYGDHPLSIGYEQTISQPYIVASMTQELHVKKSSRVLEIGTGCGYQTAVLAELCDHVYTIECIPELLADATARLNRLGYRNITCRAGDGSLGWPEHAPFDGILVAAAATDIPAPLLKQLADPGRMVIPVGAHLFNQQLVQIEKKNGRLTRTELYGVRFVPLQTLSKD
jgi:protein-L-isoaspartate(D-aspartate) O-methyltransferase